ncbi:MaoC/PaaZ C-terminal domain-containing protein [Shouchella shacheensis]|uniref:MaoC/PaaZ C-terminal domain-containing protein n=1 Tax=Shouchella shacheensis TaxID=1649580 RepID=UPI000740517F|nr:MaoC/PaaZ C-terminal domain-containing protein [Shouchella shacheensis]
MSTLHAKQVGDELSPVVLPPVSRLDLIKYAGASGDYNPIHTIDEEAENAGLPGIIAHGMWTMGNLSKLFTPYYEEGYIETYSIRFKGMVFLNDEISLKAKLTERTDSHLTFQVTALKQDGQEALRGDVVFALFQ